MFSALGEEIHYPSNAVELILVGNQGFRNVHGQRLAYTCRMEQMGPSSHPIACFCLFTVEWRLL
jgi:hypothetical protein